jgi:integral membrane protein
MTQAFRRYRVMSYVTGTTLLLLCATFVLHRLSPQTWESIHFAVKILGVGHGLVLYPIYMLSSFFVVVKFKLALWYIPLLFLAGFVPGLAFVLESRVRRIVVEGKS